MKHCFFFVSGMSSNSPKSTSAKIQSSCKPAHGKEEVCRFDSRRCSSKLQKRNKKKIVSCTCRLKLSRFFHPEEITHREVSDFPVGKVSVFRRSPLTLCPPMFSPLYASHVCTPVQNRRYGYCSQSKDSLQLSQLNVMRKTSERQARRQMALLRPLRKTDPAPNYPVEHRRWGPGGFLGPVKEKFKRSAALVELQIGLNINGCQYFRLTNAKGDVFGNNIERPKQLELLHDCVTRTGALRCWPSSEMMNLQDSYPVCTYDPPPCSGVREGQTGEKVEIHLMQAHTYMKGHDLKKHS